MTATLFDACWTSCPVFNWRVAVVRNCWNPDDLHLVLVASAESDWTMGHWRCGRKPGVFGADDALAWMAWGLRLLLRAARLWMAREMRKAVGA